MSNVLSSTSSKKSIKDKLISREASHAHGQKLFAGMDTYTFDDFGAKDLTKYYALFTYDDVPNYSKPIIRKYVPK